MTHQPDQKTPQSADETNAVDLRALSQHLGLSKGTISRALNGYPEIAERTRARVLAAAAELGYRPNRAARRLATGRNELISYIGVGSDWMTADRSFLSALSASLAAHGYGLMVSLADTMDHAETTMNQLLNDKRVDGFVFNAAFPMDARIALASARQTPMAVVGAGQTLSETRVGAANPSPSNHVPTIGIHDHAVLDGLVDYLSTLGHRHFCYFGSDAPKSVQERHAATLQASCHNRNLSFREDSRPVDGLASDAQSLLEPERAASLTNRAHQILTGSTNHPTAVFCGCERTVVALYMRAREIGLSVPDELSIIGIGSNHLASWLNGGLSTVSWSLGEAGRLAADCLIAQIEGHTQMLPETYVEAEFVARASHGPAPGGLSNTAAPADS